VRANALGHHYDEGTIVHIKPVRAADERIGAVPYEWTVDVLAQVRLVESSHGGFSHTLSFGVIRAAVAVTGEIDRQLANK
jgi:hypothetical protein